MTASCRVRRSLTSWRTTQLLAFLVVACLAVTRTRGSRPLCSSTESDVSRLNECLHSIFGPEADCVELSVLSSAPSLRLNVDCLANESLIGPLCRRSSWTNLGRCLQANVTPGKDSTSCTPFASEADCWTNVALTPQCGGSLSGICSSAFDYPKRNCSSPMTPVYLQAPRCPLANTVYVSVSFTLQSEVELRSSVLQGLVEANPFNEVILFPNLSSYNSSASIIADLDAFAAAHEASTVVYYSTLTPFFDAVVLALQHKYIFATVFLSPLTTSIGNYYNVIFITGRADRLGFVAGFALAAQSETNAVLFASNRPASLLERLYFVGFLVGAETARSAVQTVWSTLSSNTQQLWGSIQFDGITSRYPPLMFPYTVNVSGVGLYYDFLTDPPTYNNSNTTNSQHLLFSVISGGYVTDFLPPIFRGAAMGQYHGGSLYFGDYDLIQVARCVYSCNAYSTVTATALQYSFAVAHQIGLNDGIDYTLGEYRVDKTGTLNTDRLEPRGMDREYFVEPPRLVARNTENLVILGLAETDPTQRVVLGSVGIKFIQPMVLAAPSLVAPSRRASYAVAGTDLTAYVSMGLDWAAQTATHDLWQLTMSFAFDVLPRWSALPMSSASSSFVPSPRWNHSMVLWNDSLYVFGGKTSSSTMADPWLYRYDLSLQEWVRRSATPAPEARAGHEALVVNTSASSKTIGGVSCSAWLVVAGGVSAASSPSGDTLLMYCLTADVWVAVKLAGDPSVSGRTAFCLAQLPSSFASGLLIAGGGSSAIPALVVDINRESPASTDSILDVDVLSDALLTGAVRCDTVQNLAMQKTNEWMTVAVGLGSLKSSLRYYYPDVVACAGRSTAVQSFSSLKCVECPAHAYSSADGTTCIQCTGGKAEHPVCPALFNFVLVSVITSLCAVVIILAIPLSIQGIRAVRNLRRKERTQNIAVELAQSVSSLDFSRLPFLAALEDPSQLEKGFLTIFQLLVTYLQFMPMWVLAGDRIRRDLQQRGGAAARSRASDDDEDEGNGKGNARGAAPLSNAALQSHRRKLVRTAGSLGSEQQSSEPVQERVGLLAIRDRCMFEQRVTVLHVRLLNSVHGTANHRSQTEPSTVRDLSAYFANIAVQVDKHGGLLDNVVNDSVVITFNALRSCPQPELAASKCAMALVALTERWSTLSSPASVSCGLSSGNAVVGLVGKRFARYPTVIGTPLCEAIRLSDIARGAAVEQSAILVPHFAFKNHVTARVVLKVLGVVQFGGDHVSPQVSGGKMLVSTVIGKRRGAAPGLAFRVEFCNTLYEYIFNGAGQAAKFHWATAGNDAKQAAQFSGAEAAILELAIEHQSLPVLN